MSDHRGKKKDCFLLRSRSRLDETLCYFMLPSGTEILRCGCTLESLRELLENTDARVPPPEMLP